MAVKKVPVAHSENIEEKGDALVEIPAFEQVRTLGALVEEKGDALVEIPAFEQVRTTGGIAGEMGTSVVQVHIYK